MPELKCKENRFFREVNKFKNTVLYRKKSEGWKNGFKDAIHLAWQIIEEDGPDT